MDIRIGVIGLGYVGLPLALSFARRYSSVVGFDINDRKIALIKQGVDPTAEGLETELKKTTLSVTSSAGDLAGCNFFIAGVPTPVDENNTPDLEPLISACKIISGVLKKGDTVVFESTVYPGVTEEICGPVLEAGSGLRCGADFFLGYSPERINPGDKEHTIERITKVVSGQNAETLERIASVYAKVVTAGVFKAKSIKVAEAAKVIENTQRDLNIALMNELAIIFDKMGIATSDVLEAAGTKWNFLKFSPGLVGGHCIGVDPYYLTTKAQQLGYHPQVILAGRRINDGMGTFIAQRAVKLMISRGIQPRNARVGILGVTFKENVSDVRNSRVPDIYRELSEFGASVSVYDPLARPDETEHEYGFRLEPIERFRKLDCVIVAVPHREVEALVADLSPMLNETAVVVDIKSIMNRGRLPRGASYWSL